MNHLLARYFTSHASVLPDGLQQSQREAIVDLLNFCRIADDKLVPIEEAVSADEEARFTWESSVPLVAYAADSLERATVILHSPERRTEFLADVSRRLLTTETRTRAIGFCQTMFLADGDFSAPERAVFREIKLAFGWPV